MIERLLDFLFVPRCAACGERMDKSGDGLCDACRRAYEHAKDEYCDFCGMTAPQCYCMPRYLENSGCMSYRKLLFYKSDGTPVLHRLLYAVKRRNTAAAMRFLARELAAKTRDMVTAETVVTYAPRSAASYRKYGYDQARELAQIDIDSALLYCYDQTLTELVARGKLIHSDTIAAYNDMIRQGVSWRDK